MVAWEAVCAPKWVGGLGVPNLKWLHIAMQSRWPWVQHTDQSRPWEEFEIKVPEESMMICAAGSCSVLGNGMHTLFWEDRWLGGFRVQELAPNIYAAVQKSVRSSTTVHQALSLGSWVVDVSPELSVQMLHEYMALWTEVSRVNLIPDAVDSISWAWESNGHFSSRSAYEAMFWG